MKDTRFALIEDAAGLLSMLPPAHEIVWPTDEGDLRAVDEALAFMSRLLPAVKASRRAHKRMMRNGRSLAAVRLDANPR